MTKVFVAFTTSAAAGRMLGDDDLEEDGAKLEVIRVVVTVIGTAVVLGTSGAVLEDKLTGVVELDIYIVVCSQYCLLIVTNYNYLVLKLRI